MAEVRSNMKLSFSTLGCPDWSYERILEEAKKDGYDGIEIRGIEGEMRADRIACFTIGHQQAARHAAEAAGVKLIGFGSSASFHDPAKLDDALADGRTAIDVAHAMGMGFVRVFGDKIASSDDEAGIIDRVAAGVRALCDYAAGTNVLVLQEVHGDFNLARRVLAVAEKVGRDNFGILWDVAHSDKTYGDSWPEFYAAIRPLVKHVHFKDHVREANGTFRLCATGEGDIPLLPILRTLEKDGYAGYVSLEWEKKWHPELPDAADEFPHFVKYIKENI